MHTQIFKKLQELQLKADNGHIITIKGIGIDVAKAKLDITVIYSVADSNGADGSSNRDSLHTVISNNKESINHFQNELDQFLVPGSRNSFQIVFEPTSYYHKLLQQLLVSRGHNGVLCDTYKFKQYSRFLFGRNKNDRQDSHVLARLAMSGELGSGLGSELSRSKGLESQAKKLQLQTLKARIDHLKAVQITEICDIKYLQDSLESMQRQISAMQEVIEKYSIQIHSEEIMNLATTVPGISPKIASLLLSIMNPALTIKQWLAYLGLDPLNQQSRTRSTSPGLSGKGNRYLKSLIYYAGFGASVGKNKLFRPLYDKLKSRGRHHTEALLIIGKKILTIFRAVIRSGKPFDPAKLAI